MADSTPVSPGAQRIFISYAREDDEPFARRLWQDLEAHGFSVWWDREAMESRGSTFLTEIREAIDGADRVLLVVGPRVKSSPYVEMEWRHALRRGVVVTPLLRLGDYPDVPEALSLFHCEDARSSVPEPEALERVRRIASTPVPPMGPLVGVPRLPTPFVERTELLDRLLGRVLIDAHRPVDFEPDQRVTSLTGMGGTGKSVLAAALAHRPEVRRSFRDGIFWIPVGQNAPALRILSRLGLAVGDSGVDRYTGVAEARLRIEKALSGKNCLLVLDDVWDSGVVEALHTAAGQGVRILMTGRIRRIFASAGVSEVAVDSLSEREALQLLGDWTDTPVGRMPSEAHAIVGECGRLPLALAMIGAIIRGRPDRWGAALERLQAADLSRIGRKLPDYAHETLDRAMRVSFEDLPQDRRERYLDLAVLPEDARAPEAMVRTWWTREGMASTDAAEVLDELADRSLIMTGEDGSFSLHDVQRDFLLMRTEDEAALHRRWLSAFSPESPGGWSDGEDDGYFFAHLSHHLRGAGREPEWRDLLSSLAWLHRKSRADGFPAVLLDLAEYGEDPAVAPLHDALRRAAHVLAHDPDQLAAQLLARVEESPALAPVMDQARSWRAGPWLRPVRASLGGGGEPTLAVFRGREADGHAGTPRSVAISPDGKWIASGGGSSNDLTVKVWAAGAGVLVRTHDDVAAPGGVARLAFVGPDGGIAAACGADVRFFAPYGDQPAALRSFPGKTVTCIGAGGEEGSVLVGFEDGAVLAWDPREEAVSALREEGGGPVDAMAFASATRRLAVAAGNAIEVRDAGDGRLAGRLPEVDSARRWSHFQPPLLRWSPDETRLFFGSPLQAWTIGQPAAGETGALGEAVVVDLSGDGTVALAASGDRELEAVEVASGRPLGRIRNSREFSCAALSLDGRTVATGDFEHDVKLWDLSAAGAPLPAWQRRGRVGLAVVCDDPDRAVTRAGASVEIWDIATGRTVDPEDGPGPGNLLRRGVPLLEPGVRGEVIAGLAVQAGDGQSRDPRGKGGVDGGIRGLFRKLVSRLRNRGGLWEDEEMSYGLEEVPFGVFAFSPAGRRAVSAPGCMVKTADMEEPEPSPDMAGDASLEVWDLDTRRRTASLPGHTMPVTCADLTGDGALALTGSAGRVLRLWDLDAVRCLRVLKGHRGLVFSCGLTDDGRLAVSGSEDMTVRLWDLREGKLLFTFSAASAVTACDISRDGATVVAGEASGRVHLFFVEGVGSG